MKSLTDYVQFKQFPPQQLRHIFSAASDDLLQLLESLLALYPPKRCDCTQALQMAYFRYCISNQFTNVSGKIMVEYGVLGCCFLGHNKVANTLDEYARSQFQLFVNAIQRRLCVVVIFTAFFKVMLVLQNIQIINYL